MTPKDFVVFYARLWGEKYGTRYSIQFAKECRLAKRLLDTHGAETLQQYARYFLLRHPSQFADRARRTLGIFSTLINEVAASYAEEQKKLSVTESPEWARLEDARKGTK